MVLTMGVAERPTLGFRHQLLSWKEHSDDVPGMAVEGNPDREDTRGPRGGNGKLASPWCYGVAGPFPGRPGGNLPKVKQDAAFVPRQTWWHLVQCDLSLSLAKEHQLHFATSLAPGNIPSSRLPLY